MTQNDVLKMAQSNTGRIIAVSVNKEGAINRQFGTGLLLNGEYVATCYHLLIPKDSNYRLEHVYLIYNEHNVDGKHLYDSANLITGFKIKEGQYDFSKHIYKKDDFSTDFVVLKLPQKMNPVKHRYYKHPPKSLDTLYTFGNVEKDGIMYTIFQTLPFVFNYYPKVDSTLLYFTCLTTYTIGVSGSPLYNTDGEILGMVQFSIELFPLDLMNKLFEERKITEDLYRGLLNSYAEGKRFQCSIDFKYLKEKYLKGYL